MSPKVSKTLKKQSLIGQFSSNKRRISTLEQILSDQEKTINKIEHSLKRRKGRASLVLNEIGKLVRNDYNTSVKLVPIVTAIAATKQQINPTNGSLNYKSKQRRRDERLGAAFAFMALQMTSVQPWIASWIQSWPSSRLLKLWKRFSISKN